MKLSNKLLFLLAIVCLCQSPATPVSAFEDAIIAVVNDETITFRDLRDYVKSTLLALKAQGYPEEQLNEIKQDLETNGLSKLIEDKLMLSKANEIQLEVRDKAIDEKMDEIKKRYESEEVFMKALIDNGVSVTDLRNKVIEQLKIKYVIDSEVRSKIYINPQEVTNYYQENMQSFYKKEAVNLDSLFIAFKDDKAAALKKAQEALDLINKGEDFKSVAAQFSELPSIGNVERGQLLPAIEKAVFHLKLSEVSPAMEVDNGIYIFKLQGRKEAELASLDDAKDWISNLLFKKKFQDAFIAWLDNLKKEYYVEIKQ